MKDFKTKLFFDPMKMIQLNLLIVYGLTSSKNTKLLVMIKMMMLYRKHLVHHHPQLQMITLSYHHLYTVIVLMVSSLFYNKLYFTISTIGHHNILRSMNTHHYGIYVVDGFKTTSSFEEVKPILQVSNLHQYFCFLQHSPCT